MSHPSKKAKFLDPVEIEEAILEVSKLAAAKHIEVALIGGVAMELLGSDRLTKDVDFVCSDVIPRIKALHPLSFGGIAGKSPKGHPIDLVVRDDDYAPLYEEALDRAVSRFDLPVKVVRPEHLAAMKMASGRDKDELDLKMLIRLGVLSTDKTVDVIRRHLGLYAEQEFKSLCDEVEWLKSREK